MVEVLLSGRVSDFQRVLLTPELNGGRTDGEVQRRGSPERSPHADKLDQEEASQCRTDHRAECVQAVQAAQRGLEQSPVFAHEGARQDGQCATHQGGRDEQDQGCQSKPQRHAGATAEGQRARGHDVDPVRQSEHEW